MMKNHSLWETDLCSRFHNLGGDTCTFHEYELVEAPLSLLILCGSEALEFLVKIGTSLMAFYKDQMR